MGELKHIAQGQRPEESQPDTKLKLIVAGCMVVALFLIYQLVLGRFEAMPVVGQIRNAVLGAVSDVIYFFSKIVREFFYLF